MNEYIAICRKAGLTNESMFFEIEEAIFGHIEANGFGANGFGLVNGDTCDFTDRIQAWEEAHDIARRIHPIL